MPTKIKYEKIIIENERDIDELNVNDIEPLSSFGDINFRRIIDFSSAITFSHKNNELKYKVALLSKKVDWMIREYKGELYLIALKKDC